MRLIEWRAIRIGSGGTDPLPEKISDLLTKAGLPLLGIFALVGLGSSEWPIVWQLLPFYLSLFILGMPHGAADHLLLWGLTGKDSTSFKIVSLLVYVSISGLYLFAWGIWPVYSAVFFLVLTIFHWGQGDRYLTARLHGAGYLERSKLLSALHLILRGCLPIILPGYLGNLIYHDFLIAMVAQGGGKMTDFPLIIEEKTLFLVVPLALLVLYCLLAPLSARATERKALLIDLLEGVCLFFWFLFVPPLWAIGIYFVFWHSLRHALRILWIDGAGRAALQTFTLSKLSTRWLRLTTLMTVLALLGLWFILSLPLSINGIELDWLGKAMIGISILTLPHTLLVCLLDHKQSS